MSDQINYDSRWGSYRGYITVDSSGGYSYSFWGTRNSADSNNLSITLYNTKPRGGIKLTKKDFDSKKELQGVWIFITTEDKTITWDNYTSCYTWKKTDSSGQVSFQDLKVGKYYVWELNQLAGYENKFEKVGYVNVVAGNNNCTLIKDTESSNITTSGNNIYNRQYSRLQIKKIDKNTKQTMGAGFGFRIYSNVYNRWVIYSNGNVSYTTEFSNATKFPTYSNGYTQTIGKLPLGVYDIYETSLGSYDDIYELDKITVPGATGEQDAIKKSYTLTANGGNTQTFEFENQQKYVTLSGYVWVDGISSKNSRRNNLWRTSTESYTDDKDSRLNGVTVRLKRTDGSTVKSTTTDDDGKYTFTKVLAANVKAGIYYIEFEYNGLTYTNVGPYIDKNEGSKAKEISEDRTTFNNNFSVIEGGENTSGTKNSRYGYTRDNNGNKKYNLTYTISNHTATLNNAGNFKIKADTTTAGYLLKNHFEYGSPTKATIREIKNINLGLYEREQPDIAIVQDIENVKLSINGQSHIYNYASRFKNIGTNEDMFDVGVKFGEKYGNQTYSRAVYKADYKYKDPNNSKNDLNLYITYKITIKNNATNLKALIYGLDDYFSSDYEICKVGSKIQKGEISETGNMVRYETVSAYNTNYKKTRIYQVNASGSETYITLNSQSSTDIYIQFKLNRNAVESVINDNGKLQNISEIHSYSTKDRYDKTYAGIDKNSNPNNCTPGTKSTYENDTDAAPGLAIITATNERKTTGKVFLDSTTGDLKSGEIRQGDGKLSNSESGIEGIKVSMLKVNESQSGEEGLIGTLGSAQVYDEENNKFLEATATTDENGNYTISGYVPGIYKIQYTWGGQTVGDELIRVQDYKGTTQDIENVNANKNNLEWYKTTNPRYSDALDLWDTRENIDNQTKIMTNKNKSIIENYDSNSKIEVIQPDGTSNEEKLITKMKSVTPSYRVNVEYDQSETDGTRVEKTHIIRNIDFGIVERARQIVELDKRISHVKLTLPNQSVLIDTNIKENGEPENTTYIVPSQNYGLVIQIDQEMIQGSTLELEYEFELTNKSEVDFMDKDFYLYGIISSDYGNNLVTLTPNSIIDYLDNNISSYAEENTNWKKIDKVYTLNSENSVNYLYRQGLLSEGANKSAKEFIKNATRSVLILDNMRKKLKPGSSNNTTSATLTCSKLLASNDQEIALNYGEIIQVTKSGGATLRTTPGNYIPADSSTSEADNSNSGDVQIMNNTGLETDYIAYTILAISSLGILLAGIILIKKYVLTK